MAPSRNRRRAELPSRIRYKSSGQNNTVVRIPASSPAVLRRTPLEKSCLPRPRNSLASKVNTRSRLATSPLRKAESIPIMIISLS